MGHSWRYHPNLENFITESRQCGEPPLRFPMMRPFNSLNYIPKKTAPGKPGAVKVKNKV